MGTGSGLGHGLHGGDIPPVDQVLEQAPPRPAEGPGTTGCGTRTRGNGDTTVRPGVLPAQAAVTQLAGEKNKTTGNVSGFFILKN